MYVVLHIYHVISYVGSLAEPINDVSPSRPLLRKFIMLQLWAIVQPEAQHSLL